jgi:transcriptional regulator with XRE-family HTH domain
MKTLAERIKYARLKLGLTQEDVAKEASMTQQGYRDIEIERSKRPRNIQKIAEALNVPLQWLQFGIGPSPFDENAKHIPEGHALIIPWSLVGDWVAGKKDEAFKQSTGIVPSFESSQESYALKIANEAMVGSNKSFHVGEIIVVDPQKQPTQQCYVVVLKKGAKEAIMRHYEKDGDMVYLLSPHAKYPALQLLEGDKICGVVIAHLDLMN